MGFQPSAAITDAPGHRVMVETSPRRVRVSFNGEVIADSSAMLLVHESRHLPVYYFPREDVRTQWLSRTDHASHCPYKGDASYWSVSVGDRVAENAVWSYESPLPEVAGLAGAMAFYWNKMDHWHEEDEEIFVHARDPYTRVDVVDSRRQVRAVLGGETVAESTNARFLYETGLPTRTYLPRADVRVELLEQSATVTRCPYKGVATHFSARIGESRFEDVAWSYPEPIAECPRIKDRICFYDERVDAILIDGQPVAKPRTRWTRD